MPSQDRPTRWSNSPPFAVATGGAYAEVLPTRFRFVVKPVIVREP